MTRTLLTIGAGPGIGAATAQRFADEGWRVVLASRDPQRLERTLAAAGVVDVEFDTVDAADPHAVAALVGRHQRDLSVLHYNAGVLHHDAAGALQPRRLEDESIGSLATDLQINVTSALAAIGPAADAIERNGGGSILLTGGGLGIDPSPQFLTLSTGKAALRAAAQALFEPMKRRGIHLATVTVSTLVDPDSAHAHGVAQAFWALHAQPRDTWAWETIYR